MAEVENKVSLENLRKGDILTLNSQVQKEGGAEGEMTNEVVTVRSAVHHPGGAGVVIELAENYALLYHYDGSCPDVPALSVKSVEFVELPEDKETYYIPNADIIIAPVVAVKGRNKVIVERVVNTVFDLNSFPILPSGSKLVAGMKHIAVFTLSKTHNRKTEIIKKEMIICDSADHAKAEVKRMRDRYDEQPDSSEGLDTKSIS